MRQTDFERDMAFGQVSMIVATPDEDMKENTDLRWRGLRVAWRRRAISVDKYKQVSIRYRRRSGTSTERDKILDGTSKAHLYVFEFTDAWVMCRLSDIRDVLMRGSTEVVANRDGTTEAIYINIADLPCLIIRFL